jgi:hypothetical protein
LKLFGNDELSLSTPNTPEKGEETSVSSLIIENAMEKLAEYF